jgi:type IV secretion system protein TrbL
MRAVSLANGVVAGVVGAGAADGTEVAMGAEAAAAVPMGRGTGVLATGKGGGTNVRGAGTLVTGGLGNGAWEIGGRGIGTVPGFAGSGVGVDGASDVGGRAGRLIRTVSLACGATASSRRGGRVIRTVSFFGSLASAIVTLTGGKTSLSEISGFVTVN